MLAGADWVVPVPGVEDSTLAARAVDVCIMMIPYV
jgi:hypothetical protein